MSSDRPLDLSNDEELRFARERGFFDRSRWVRLGLLVCFALAVFSMLHFHEVRVELAEIDSVAPHYVVAQIDFSFLDQDATRLLRKEAARDIGEIYQLYEKEVRSYQADFEQQVLANPKWRELLPNTTYEELYAGVDLLGKLLLQLRFTDPRTLRKINSEGLPSEQVLLFTPGDGEALLLPIHVRHYLFGQLKEQEGLSDEPVNFLLAYFFSKKWNFDLDHAMMALLRQKVQEQVPDKYTFVQAGSRLIDQGDRVTTRHLVMLQAMKQALSEQRNLSHPATLLGSALLTAILLLISLSYCRVYQPDLLTSNRKLALVIAVLMLTMLLSKLVELTLLNSRIHLFDFVRYPVVVPLAAILLCTLTNFSIALYATGFLSALLTITLVFEQQGFLLMNLSAALVALLATGPMRHRKEVFVVCFRAWVVCVAIAIAIHLYRGSFASFGLLIDFVSVSFSLLLTGILAVGLLPLLEALFHIMTDVSLMEYMDPNSELLRRLSIEAPGTYQHSILVGNLAESAAMAIGANGLFCRVATLYHDIGKIATPQYFTENQQGGVNVHQLLTPKESAHVILSHITEGVAMARKAGLPEQFIDIIKEHHGTQLVYYFYRKELERCGNDPSRIHDKDFRYSGPKPRSKESAIIMLADVIEAASRSMPVIDEASLMELANRLIQEKNEDHQLDECLLTLEELAIVKKTLVKNLVAFGHSRIKYPRRVFPAKDLVDI